MKKFSVLLVAILALMMLFVSCENEPKERVATMKDGAIVSELFEEASYFYKSVAGGKEYSKIEYDSNTKIATFKGFEVYDVNDNLLVALNGTVSMIPDEKAHTATYSLNLEDGTKYKSDDHTLLATFVMKMSEEGYPVDVDSYEIMLDGVILTDFVFGY